MGTSGTTSAAPIRGWTPSCSRTSILSGETDSREEGIDKGFPASDECVDRPVVIGVHMDVEKPRSRGQRFPQRCDGALVARDGEVRDRFQWEHVRQTLRGRDPHEPSFSELSSGRTVAVVPARTRAIRSSLRPSSRVAISPRYSSVNRRASWRRRKVAHGAAAPEGRFDAGSTSTRSASTRPSTAARSPAATRDGTPEGAETDGRRPPSSSCAGAGSTRSSASFGRLSSSPWAASPQAASSASIV